MVFWRPVFFLLMSVSALAGDRSAPLQRPVVEADGTVRVPAFAMPYSSLASGESRKHLVDAASRPLQTTPGDINKTRQDIDAQLYKPLLKSLQGLFKVSIKPALIGGVQTDVVTPSDGVSPLNRFRVLINLHGGAFQSGARLGGQVESIPISALGQIKVVAVDYRLGPENKFPAASEDIAKVYQALLMEYRPEAIGIYGCSAGGMLTAQAIAWIQSRGLPVPGAAGIFGAGAMAYGAGDSVYTNSILTGYAVLTDEAIIKAAFEPYFGKINLNDPLASPVHAPAVLARFPPTLLISGTRDMYLSSATYTHSRLIKARVDADLHVWEGVGHCFIFSPELPEAREAWDVIVDFFDKNLSNDSRQSAVTDSSAYLS